MGVSTNGGTRHGKRKPGAGDRQRHRRDGDGPHEALVRRFIAAIEQRDADAYAACFAEDAVAQHPLVPDPIRGRDQIRSSEQALYDAFSDVRVELRSLLSSRDCCAMEVVLRATNTGPLDLGDEQPLPATGRSIGLPAVWWCEIADDGLIAAARDYFDTATLMAQLGLGAH